jgi:dCTP diphosphatase
MEGALSLQVVRDRLREFASERDWEQFHHPKNLSMAVAVEVAELLELFQWMSDAQSRGAASDAELMFKIRDELADVLIYLVRLADVLGVDLETEAVAKIQRNAVRYPVATSRGSANKAS